MSNKKSILTKCFRVNVAERIKKSLRGLILTLLIAFCWVGTLHLLKLTYNWHEPSNPSMSSSLIPPSSSISIPSNDDLIDTTLNDDEEEDDFEERLFNVSNVTPSIWGSEFFGLMVKPAKNSCQETRDNYGHFISQYMLVTAIIQRARKMTFELKRNEGGNWRRWKAHINLLTIKGFPSFHSLSLSLPLVLKHFCDSLQNYWFRSFLILSFYFPSLFQTRNHRFVYRWQVTYQIWWRTIRVLFNPRHLPPLQLHLMHHSLWLGSVPSGMYFSYPFIVSVVSVPVASKRKN